METVRTTETRRTGKKHSSESGKAETVYVMADASGAANEIIVSEWLRNQRGASVLEDFSNLTDIENVEGYEEFTKNSDGSMTWQADGSDIYYQGRTDAKLPVGVSLSYKLDGKEIAADELAGKSGRVTIRFDYTNNLTAETMVNGKEETIAVPFAMISGAVLDGDRFSNIEVTNGKVVSEGSNNIVVGMAFPGLKESLNLSVIKKNFDDEEDKKKLDDLEEDIPDYVEITADVTDFKLDMTLTMASSDLLNDLNLDDIDTSELKDSMNDLDEATQELIDGVDELKDGTGQLADGAGELSDGAGQLSDGAGQLSDGADKLADGAGTLDSSVGQAQDKADQLADGAKKVSDGADQVSDGTAQLNGQVPALTEGVSALYEGAKQLRDGSSQARDGADQLAAAAAELLIKTGQLSDSADQLAAGAQSVSDGIGLVDRNLNTLYDGMGQLAEGTASLEENTKNLNAGMAQVAGGLQQASQAVQQLDQGLSGLDDLDADKIRSSLSALTRVDPEELSSKAKSLSSTAGRLNGLRENLEGLKTSAESARDAAGSRADGYKSDMDSAKADMEAAAAKLAETPSKGGAEEPSKPSADAVYAAIDNLGVSEDKDEEGNVTGADLTGKGDVQSALDDYVSAVNAYQEDMEAYAKASEPADQSGDKADYDDAFDRYQSAQASYEDAMAEYNQQTAVAGLAGLAAASLPDDSTVEAMTASAEELSTLLEQLSTLASQAQLLDGALADADKLQQLRQAVSQLADHGGSSTGSGRTGRTHPQSGDAAGLWRPWPDH